MNKKILLINQLFSPAGGAELIAYDTYKMLKRSNYNVFFWATDKKPYFEQNYEYTEYFTPYNYGIKNYIKNPIKYYYNNKAKNDLSKFIKFVKPDLIHLHNFFWFSPSIFSCFKNIPTIMTVHDAQIICPTGLLLHKNEKYCVKQYCNNYNFLPCIKARCAHSKLEPSIRRALYNYICAKKLKYIDRFITPSYALKQTILNANIGIKSTKIDVINNFLPSEYINQQPNFNNNKYFLYVGRLSKEKGLHYLLASFKDLPHEVKLRIVGTGPEENSLKQFALDNNMNNVKFLGFKNREEIKKEYLNCIATILPCNWFENFPTTNMESFSYGKPVIASNIGGIPEQVEHNKTGLLFEPANTEQIKECIFMYWNNPDLVIEHGKNARQKAVTKYTAEQYYQNLIQAYEKLLDNERIVC